MLGIFSNAGATPIYLGKAATRGKIVSNLLTLVSIWLTGNSPVSRRYLGPFWAEFTALNG